MPAVGKNSKLYLYLTAVVIIAFTAFKTTHLSLPYFWDELGVFGTGINHQYHNGISLMPKSVPPLVSRGHPLFFTFLYAGYAKLLGSNSVTVVHSLTLLLAIVLLCSVYYVISKQHSREVAFLSVALLAAQPLFIAQSGMALPEMLLALLVWWAMYTYITGNFIWFMLFTSLAVLTKETALLIPMVCGAFTVWQLLWGAKKLHDISISRVLSIIIGPLVFGVFLLIQKQQNGWYFFDYHINAVKVDYNFIAYHVHRFIVFILYKQGRNQWIIVFAAGLLAALLGNRINRHTVTKGMLPIGLFLLVAVIAFYSSTFYMNRYLLLLYPFLTLTIALCITQVFKHFRIASLTIIAVLCALNLGHLDDDGFAYDDNMAYVKTLNVTQQAIDKLALLPTGGVYANFPAYYAVTEPEKGYRNIDKLKPVNQLTDTNTQYLLECQYSFNWPDSITAPYNKTYIFKDGFAVVNLYVKK